MSETIKDTKAAFPAIVASGFAVLAIGAAVVSTGLLRGVFAAVAAAGTITAAVIALRLAQQLADARHLQWVLTAELRKERENKPANVQPGPGTGGPHQNPADTANAILCDEETGLFSEAFFTVTLDARISTARRHLRPVSVVALEVVEGLPDAPDSVSPSLVADTIRSVLRESDTASHLKGRFFALLLEDTPENGAIWTVERIRRKVLETRPELTVRAGVACYPAHAFSSGEIVDAAEAALAAAREWRQHRIEVAVSAD